MVKTTVDKRRLAVGALIKGYFHNCNLYVIMICTDIKLCFQGFQRCYQICDMLDIFKVAAGTI